MTKAQEAAKQEAIGKLRVLLPPGSKVYCILRHMSRSGMSRVISFQIVTAEGDIRRLDHLISLALNYRMTHNCDGLKVSGCGMDLGFHVVYSLSYALYSGGYGCTGSRCKSNDHSNGDRDYTMHREPMNGDIGVAHWHRDGGYALTSAWI